MIILPDRNLSRSKFLMPVSKNAWRESSLAQPKDQFGNPTTKIMFKAMAKLNDGYVKWQGWFEDRDDFDAFIWAIATDTLKRDKSLWSLCSPMWDPSVDENVTYQFATVTHLTTTGSNQTYNKPADWNDLSNTIECVGAGGSGGASNYSSTGSVNVGAGGGAYSRISNFVFSGSSATYRVGTGGPAASITFGTTAASGTTGGPTWFNNATDPGVGTDNTKCSAAGGVQGTARTSGSGTISGGAGGATTASWGQTKYAGGRGGSSNGSSSSTGGGGAGGNDSNGSNGEDITVSSDGRATQGGNGGNTGGGTGGAANATNTGTPGGAGTNFGVSHGSGGGGGGTRLPAGGGSIISGCAGGNYGAGGGGGRCNANPGTAISGAGAQGLIIVTYDMAAVVNTLGNLPMLGM